MNILAITAGAAGMYCGSCFRDNALAAELVARGHDVVLLPLYTPTRTDEPNVSRKEIFFGGISVYLEQFVPLFRRVPPIFDALWDAPWLLKWASKKSIQTDPRVLGELTVSMLRGENGHQRKEVDKLIGWLRKQPLPDVINLPNSLLIGLAAPLKRALGRPVCCTLQGEDLFLNGLSEPYRGTALDLIRSHVEHVDAFLAVSDYYAGFMSETLGIPAARMQVVPLGINLEGYRSEPAPRRGDTFTIGYFARVAPEKGLHRLCEAFRRLREKGVIDGARLEAAGYLGAEHRAYLDSIQARMKEWGLAGEFHYRGELDRREKIEFLQGLDVLSVPATYDEPKGMFLLEAMAGGVPVVQPRRGAFTEIVEKTSGGILVDPDDMDSLADGILSLVRDPARAAELGRNGADGVRKYYSVSRMADRALEVYSGLV